MDDIQEWDRCLTEASFTDTAANIRRLFVYIIHENQPADVASLWERHADSLSDDFAHLRCRSLTLRPFAILEVDHINALKNLRDQFMSRGVVYTTLGLPPIPADVDHVPISPVPVYDIGGQIQIVQHFLMNSNEEQLYVFHAINDTIHQYLANSEAGIV